MAIQAVFCLSDSTVCCGKYRLFVGLTTNTGQFAAAAGIMSNFHGHFLSVLQVCKDRRLLADRTCMFSFTGG